MPDDPTTEPIDVFAWLRWRCQKKSPPQSVLDALAEILRLALVGIVEIVAIKVLRGLLSEPTPEVVPAEELAQYQFKLEVYPDVVAGYNLSRPDYLLVPHAPGFPVYGDLKFRLIQPAEFQQYLDGALAALGLLPPPPPDDEPLGLPEFEIWPPGTPPPSPEHVGPEKLVDIVVENFSENPGRDKFYNWCKKKFQPPRYRPVRRSEADKAVHHLRAVKVLGSVRDPRDGRPRRNKKGNPPQN